MNDEPDNRQSDADREIEREIRQSRKVTAKDVMAQLAGPGAMKGASPVSPVQQAETEIGNWLGNNLRDGTGSLKVVLHRHLKGSGLLFDSLDQPMDALSRYLQQLLANDNLLGEIVREADVEWGRVMDERPHFEREGMPPSPDDPYTLDGVRTSLADALRKLPS